MESRLRKACYYNVKALVLRCETKGFTARNQGFHDLKPRVSQMKGINKKS